MAEAEARELFERAVAAQRGGRRDEAIDLYRRVSALNPRSAAARNNLGMLLIEADKLEQAVVELETAVTLRPDYPEALNNLGIALRRLRDLPRAEVVLRRSLELRPDNGDAHYNLGYVLRDANRLPGAAAEFRRSLELRPDRVTAFLLLADTLADLGDHAGAIAALARAALLDPDNGAILGALENHHRLACDWREIDRLQSVVLSAVREGDANVDPSTLILNESTPEEQLVCVRAYAAGIAASCTPLPPAGRSRPSGRLRIGYLSEHFRSHATARLLVETIELHDRERFEAIAYSYGRDDASPLRRRIERAFDRFVEIGAMSDLRAAQRIREDGVDILVDLMGYVGTGRTEILAYRPSPVQVNYLGYPGTMGAPFIDYIVADPFLVPEGGERFYAEKLAVLPRCYQPNDRKREIAGRAPTRAECGLPEPGFVFCCFNHPRKLNPRMFDIWMRLLEAVPGSVLWLLEGAPGATANLRREAAARGVSGDRLVFAPRLPLAEHMARHRVADLFLDTLPCNAHTTMSDALWEGLPAVSCAGQTFAGRVGGSLLHAVGLAELVAENLADYETLALALARDPDRLRAIRERLIASRPNVPLFDTPAYTRALEAAFQRMWEMHAGGQSPQSFRISADGEGTERK